MTEKEICKAFYAQYKELESYNQFPKKMLVFHIANEHFTKSGYIFNLLAIGLTAGVADYCILMEGGKVAFIEFKRNARLKLDKNQKRFKQQCEEFGIQHFVAYTPDDGIEFLKSLCG